LRQRWPEAEAALQLEDEIIVTRLTVKSAANDDDAAAQI